MNKRIFISVKPAGFESAIFTNQELLNKVRMLKGCGFNDHNKILSYDNTQQKFVPYAPGAKIIMLSDAVEICDINEANIIINDKTDYLIKHSTCSIDNNFSKIMLGHHVENNPVYVSVFKAILKEGDEDKIVNRIITKLRPYDDAKLIDEFLTRVWLGEKPSEILNDSKYKQFNFTDYKNIYECIEENGVTDKAFEKLQTELINAIK